jgi:hypothetical protein
MKTIEGLNSPVSKFQSGKPMAGQGKHRTCLNEVIETRNEKG